MQKTDLAIVGALVVSVSALMLAARRDSLVGPAQAATTPAAGLEGPPARPRGLTYRLSEGAPDVRPAERPRVAEATPLGDVETGSLFARLPAISASERDEQPFAAREATLPPPRPGRTVAGVFPADAPRVPPPTLSREPLEVLRRAPDGEVPLAPHVSVTFSQPMVAVTSHADLANTAPPVTITPHPAGAWRWIGARTAVFESEPRLPMATDYTVEIPAGTSSASGGTLSHAVRWTFATPAPTLVRSHPTGGPMHPDSLLYAEFDQRIDPAAVLRSVRLQSDAGPVGLRLATAQEIDADAAVNRLVKRATAGRWLAFRATEPLPLDTQIGVTVGPGTPSSEGPKTTTQPQTWSFRTFGHLRVGGHRCGWTKRCVPGNSWHITFSNPLDAEAFSSDMVRVEPPLREITARALGTEIVVQGISKGRTTYRVTVASGLKDVFGRTLGSAHDVSFQVEPAEPWLTSPGDDFVVLDPAAAPRSSVYSTGIESLSIQMRVVQPADWPAYRQATDAWPDDVRPSWPGRLVHSVTIPVKGGLDDVTETPIDLSPALPNGRGQILLTIEAERPALPSRVTVVKWIQSTRIGLDAFADTEELVAWATALDTGQPLPGVQVSLLGRPTVGVTGTDGVARLALDPQPSPVLVGRSGTDVAILPHTAVWYQTNVGWRAEHGSGALRWYVAGDRGVYRPNEEVRLKGWLRLVRGGKSGGLTLVGAVVREVTYSVRDHRGNEIGSGAVSLNRFGGFDTIVKLPANVSLGYAFIEFKADAGGVESATYNHFLQIQEFRRPEFEVTTTVSAGPHMVGGSATASVRASYYAGGGLPDAAVRWQVRSSPGSFTPPNRGDFAFGYSRLWWESSREMEADWPSADFAGRTDSSGGHVLRVDLDGANPPQVANLHIEATVVDVNRQAWTSASDMVVHPAALAVGLRSDRYFVQRGEPLVVQSIAVDLEGRAVAGRTVRVTSERLRWEPKGGTWTQVVLDPQVCTVTSGAAPSSCTFATPEGGECRVTAEVTDLQGRTHRTRIHRWVSGGEMPSSRNVEQERVTLVPGREKYRAGETAEVLILPPFTPAEALVTLRRSGLVRTERVSIAAGSYTLKIPVDGAWTPSIDVQVDLVGSVPRAAADGSPNLALPRRPAFARGSLTLSIPPVERTLALTVEPRVKNLLPGGETVLDLTLRDARGHAVSEAEAAVVVVDEAVLSLTGYRLPNPLDVFYFPLGDNVSDHHLRGHVVLGQLDQQGRAAAEMEVLRRKGPFVLPVMAESVVATTNRASAQRARNIPDGIRSDFGALALFAPSVPTDASGRATVRVKVPDSLTRYRVMAVAVAGGTQFGSGESTLTASLPLMIRPSPPRFLNFGDQIELPVVVQNQTGQPMSVAVAVRATNLNVTAGAGRRVLVPAHDRVEVRFPVSASRPGTARIQIAARSGRWADASEVSVPIWTPATSEAFATYGEVDEGAVAHPVKAPPGAIAEYGGLEFTTTSTAVQALTDGVLYLVDYPFSSAEHLSSRILAIAALKNVLAAFRASSLPDPDALSARVNTDLERLADLQNADGGFAMWRPGDDVWPYVSIHAAHALQRAFMNGFAVRAQALERARSHLRNIERYIPNTYGTDVRHTLVAYALYVRRLMGDRDAARARLLIEQAGLRQLSPEAVGWLLAVLSGDHASAGDVAAIWTHLANQVTETSGAAHFAVSYGDAAHLLLASNRRADAIVLDAIMTDQPKHDLIPKIVAGLMAHRSAGRWENTQENAFVLLALGRYFDTYERVTPDFLARVWLGHRYAGQQLFRGRSTDRFTTTVPMKTLAAAGPADLIVAKQGPGRLYYRIGVRYAPASLTVEALDRGFTVERTYEGVDDEGDVRRDADGTWHVRAGARVRTRISVVAPARRYHVALVDPMPAGFEALNPALKTTERIPDEKPQAVAVTGADALGGPDTPGRWWFWLRSWFDHQNLRDERVEAFASLLWEGVYSYSYVSRATTPGQFVVGAPRVEEMYHPETFGRGATDRVVVADPRPGVGAPGSRLR